MNGRILTLAILGSITASQAAANWELSFYSGVQTAPHSRVKGSENGNSFNFLSEWEGRSDVAPPYYGLRATWWQNEKWGYGIDINHAKVYASDDTLRDNGFSDLEFTDGHNLITLNGYRRWQNESQWTPYVGAGLGVAIPHVDVKAPSGRATNGYQVSGVAAVILAGVSYEINDTWSVFGEYKGSYSANKVDLSGGGDLETNLVTNAFNLGVSYNF